MVAGSRRGRWEFGGGDGTRRARSHGVPALRRRGSSPCRRLAARRPPSLPPSRTPFRSTTKPGGRRGASSCQLPSPAGRGCEELRGASSREAAPARNFWGCFGPELGRGRRALALPRRVGVRGDGAAPPGAPKAALRPRRVGGERALRGGRPPRPPGAPQTRSLGTRPCRARPPPGSETS